jgi:hypothetical protein
MLLLCIARVCSCNRKSSIHPALSPTLVLHGYGSCTSTIGADSCKPNVVNWKSQDPAKRDLSLAFGLGTVTFLDFQENQGNHTFMKKFLLSKHWHVIQHVLKHYLWNKAEFWVAFPYKLCSVLQGTTEVIMMGWVPAKSGSLWVCTRQLTFKMDPEKALRGWSAVTRKGGRSWAVCGFSSAACFLF